MDTQWIEVNESKPDYGNQDNYPFQNETFSIIGACFEVFNELGKGFLEVVYKDALTHEFNKRGIVFEREKKFEITYKDVKLKHFYIADFVVQSNIILEVKAQDNAVEEHYKQVLNYLAASKCKIGLIVNFGENSLKYKRVILSK